ncbi:hypothetical protein [Peterkaempfera sp. SMS 1(5)a]|uniref:hypothetical protein n=1 Tax=Peterkaempfera podocarpi TaxID=3232308 RepID=UPI003672B4C1
MSYLHVAVGISGGASSVLTTASQARSYPGWFDRSGEHAIADQLRALLGRPGAPRPLPAPGRALVAVTAAVGCAQPRSAELWADGADLSVRWTGARATPQECLAAFKAVAVFQVPVGSLPAHPTIGGRQPDPAGP